MSARASRTMGDTALPGHEPHFDFDQIHNIVQTIDEHIGLDLAASATRVCARAPVYNVSGPSSAICRNQWASSLRTIELAPMLGGLPAVHPRHVRSVRWLIPADLYAGARRYGRE